LENPKTASRRASLRLDRASQEAGQITRSLARSRTTGRQTAPARSRSVP
jgi:hypothetical protein